jgi:polysaccharide pyruvyl transferase WcaK-like protein
MSTILVLHAYSADNGGDGLLVRETLELIMAAVGEDAVIDVAASYPESFSRLNVNRVLDSQPRAAGYDSEYFAALRGIDDYDLVVAVGGGYLRGGHLIELAKAALVHGPQLLAASKRGVGTIYLPQSVGPMRFGTRRIMEHLLKKIQHVVVRDDRSLIEFPAASLKRGHDLALLDPRPRQLRTIEPLPKPVISARPLRGVVPPRVVELSRRIRGFDGYVQSTAGHNNDHAAMVSLHPDRLLSREELIDNPSSVPRIVIAVRLHAALMALNAGHFVIHLAYERKGFGAFSDLGLSRFVHNINKFDIDDVLRQIQELQTSLAVRNEYASHVGTARKTLHAYRSELIQLLASAAHDGAARRDRLRRAT